MAEKVYKVYGWQGWRPAAAAWVKETKGQSGRATTREIVAARSKAEVKRITGETEASLFAFSETGNARELEIALAEPGVVFWRPIDDRSGNYRRVV